MTNENKGLIGSILGKRGDYSLFSEYCNRLEKDMESWSASELEDFKSMKEEDLIDLHHNLGQHIRSCYGLWEANLKMHPDDVSFAVILYVHHHLNGGTLSMCELRHAQIEYEVSCGMDISHMSEEDREKIYFAKQAVFNLHELHGILEEE